MRQLCHYVSNKSPLDKSYTSVPRSMVTLNRRCQDRVRKKKKKRGNSTDFTLERSFCWSRNELLDLWKQLMRWQWTFIPDHNKTHRYILLHWFGSKNWVITNQSHVSVTFPHGTIFCKKCVWQWMKTEKYFFNPLELCHDLHIWCLSS